jgi:hypothetical protein
VDPLAKKKANKELEAAVIKVATSGPATVVMAVGAGVYLLPVAAKYLAANVEEGIAYYIGGLWQGIKGSPKDAKELIEDSGKYYRDQYDAWKRQKDQEAFTETNPNITTPEIVDGISIENWRRDNDIPASADFILNPQDAYGLHVIAISRPAEGAPYAWNYYGVKTINGQKYWMVIPSTVTLYHTVTDRLPDGRTITSRYPITPLPWPAAAQAHIRTAMEAGTGLEGIIEGFFS